ncbi:MAG: hypothetical protein H7235_05655 [Bdellovibrionaceae bacterium]|nr:hypothetical protein [Pseudobdellovibrionaceae bacterium]
MKIILLVLAFMIPGLLQAQPAAPRDFGIGLAIGSPTAITGKVWLTNAAAIDMGLAYSSHNYVLVYGDYLLHTNGLFGQRSELSDRFTTYIGIGLGIYSWDRGYYYEDRPAGWRRKDGDLGAYARIPLGLEWTPRHPSIGVFVELVPGISIIPSIDAVINAALGIRYYF